MTAIRGRAESRAAVHVASVVAGMHAVGEPEVHSGIDVAHAPRPHVTLPVLSSMRPSKSLS